MWYQDVFHWVCTSFPDQWVWKWHKTEREAENTEKSLSVMQEDIQSTWIQTSLSWKFVFRKSNTLKTLAFFLLRTQSKYERKVHRSCTAVSSFSCSIILDREYLSWTVDISSEHRETRQRNAKNKQKAATKEKTVSSWKRKRLLFKVVVLGEVRRRRQLSRSLSIQPFFWSSFSATVFCQSLQSSKDPQGTGDTKETFDKKLEKEFYL